MSGKRQPCAGGMTRDTDDAAFGAASLWQPVLWMSGYMPAPRWRHQRLDTERPDDKTTPPPARGSQFAGCPAICQPCAGGETRDTDDTAFGAANLWQPVFWMSG